MLNARVEERIRIAKDTGLSQFPSREFTINRAWLIATMVAADLVASTRLLSSTGEAKVLAAKTANQILKKIKPLAL